MLNGNDYLAGLHPEYLIGRAAKILLAAVAIRTESEWFHGSFVVVITVYQLSWVLRLYETVG